MPRSLVMVEIAIVEKLKEPGLTKIKERNIEGTIRNRKTRTSSLVSLKVLLHWVIVYPEIHLENQQWFSPVCSRLAKKTTSEKRTGKISSHSLLCNKRIY